MKVPFFVSPDVCVSLSAAKSDSTDVSQDKKTKQNRRYSEKITQQQILTFQRLEMTNLIA